MQVARRGHTGRMEITPVYHRLLWPLWTGVAFDSTPRLNLPGGGPLLPLTGFGPIYPQEHRARVDGRATARHLHGTIERAVRCLTVKVSAESAGAFASNVFLRCSDL